MKASMKHPLWTHLPAAAVLGGLVASMVAAWPFPQRMPLHFDFYGRPDRYGSPWEAVVVFSAVLLLLLIGSIALDETWARQETRKRFNWLGLLDELVIGFVGGTGIGAFALVAEGKTDFTFPWRMGVMLALAAVPAAAVLEVLRPHRPSEHQPLGEAARVDDLVARIRAGGHWTWWESQNPWLMNLAIGGGGAMILILTIALPVPLPIRILNLVVGTLLIGLCGGMRISLTPERLTVRFGLLSIPVFRVRLENITEAAEQEFSPLADFGGWGIRVNRQMWAFFLRGTRGVRVKTAKGKLYLIGSDHPERLTAILRAAMPVRGDIAPA
jgi:hypothetical protein